KGNRLVLIDNELCFSISADYPNPPFEMGTYGFMSPEQLEVQRPTGKEDVYGFSATLIVLLTGLPPIVFDPFYPELCFENLLFFVQDFSICRMIVDSLDVDPLRRPSEKMLIEGLTRYKGKLHRTRRLVDDKIEDSEVRDTIDEAIAGLVLPPTLIVDDIWQSRAISSDALLDSQRKYFGKATGIFEGIGGVLYLLGKAKEMGFDVSRCEKPYRKGWNYIQTISGIDAQQTPGLYGGTAGIALAAGAGIDAGLVPAGQFPSEFIERCLAAEPSGVDVATGAAGQGIVALQCSAFV
ncbi:MAG TPA: hypothetical protein VHS53_16965, partial [Mucilaginibacter sp.]|nr:hypothetical protein [Mucilaginibacter sp.]